MNADNLHLAFDNLSLNDDVEPGMIIPNQDDEKDHHQHQDEKEEGQYHLLPHQEVAVRWMNIRETEIKQNLQGGILGMVMGMGKSYTTLTQIFNTRQDGYPTLIVCPKTAMYTWKNEIQKFFGDAIKIFVYRKDQAKLERVTPDILKAFDVVITNYEYLRCLNSKLKADKHIEININSAVVGMNTPKSPILDAKMGESVIYSMKWYRIVADESHNFSNFKTALWKAMMSLCGERRWCLTGTPIRNWDDDVYSQFKWLGYTDNAFNQASFRKKDMSEFIHYIDYEKAGIKLPEATHHKIKLNLHGHQLKIYKYYLKQAREAYNEWVAGCRNFSSVLVCFLRLRQACVAPYTITPQSARNYKMTEAEEQEYFQNQRSLERELPGLINWMHDKTTSSGLDAEKIAHAVEIIKGIPKGEKTIVFTMFKRVIDLLTEKLGDHRKSVHIDGDITGKLRDDTLNTFKTNPEFEVLFISYKVGSESLNLTEANHIILLEPWWSFAVIEQAKARVHRMGQTKPVTIYELAATIDGETSIEEKIMSLSDSKKQNASKYLDGNKGNKKQNEGLNAEMLGDLLF